MILFPDYYNNKQKYNDRNQTYAPFLYGSFI